MSHIEMEINHVTPRKQSVIDVSWRPLIRKKCVCERMFVGVQNVWVCINLRTETHTKDTHSVSVSITYT